MTEVKRGALQSPADTARTTDTVVRHVQNIDEAGNVIGGGSTPFDHETLTVAATAVGLTAATYLDATRDHPQKRSTDSELQRDPHRCGISETHSTILQVRRSCTETKE
jgi:hypothetical protein